MDGGEESLNVISHGWTRLAEETCSRSARSIPCTRQL
jgi:hypothetical protein